MGPYEEKSRFPEDIDPEGEEKEYSRHAKLGQRGVISVRYELMIGLGKAPDRVDPVFLIDARIVFAGGMGRETGQTAAKGKIILQDIDGGGIEYETGQKILFVTRFCRHPLNEV